MQLNYYKSLKDISIYNYDLALGGDYKYCRIELNEEIEINEDDYKAFCALYDEYLKRYGIGRKYSLYLDKVDELTVLKCEKILTGNLFLENKIRMLEHDIEEFKKGERGDIYNNLPILSKVQGYYVDPKQTPALIYFELIKNLEKDGKES